MKLDWNWDDAEDTAIAIDDTPLDCPVETWEIVDDE